MGRDTTVLALLLQRLACSGVQHKQHAEEVQHAVHGWHTAMQWSSPGSEWLPTSRRICSTERAHDLSALKSVGRLQRSRHLTSTMCVVSAADASRAHMSVPSETVRLRDTRNSSRKAVSLSRFTRPFTSTCTQHHSQPVRPSLCPQHQRPFDIVCLQLPQRNRAALLGQHMVIDLLLV